MSAGASRDFPVAGSLQSFCGDLDGGAWRPAFHYLLRPYEGGWMEACEIYRDWARALPGFDRPPYVWPPRNHSTRPVGDHRAGTRENLAAMATAILLMLLTGLVWIAVTLEIAGIALLTCRVQDGG